MKKLLCSIAALTFILGLAGCGQEEVTTNPDNGKEQVDLSAGIETTVIEAEAKSRAATPGSLTAFTEKSFTMIVKDGRTGEGVTTFSPISGVAATSTTLTGTPIDIVTNASAEGGVNPAKITFSPTLYWDDLGGRAGSLNFYGIYPPVEAAIIDQLSTLKWSVALDQSASEATPGANPNDLLLAYRDDYTYLKRKIAANLHFKHVLTKITLRVKAGDNFTTEFNPAVTLINLPVSGTVSLTPDTALDVVEYPFNEVEANPQTVIIPTKSNKDTDGFYTFTAIVLPNDLSVGQIFANVTVGGHIYKVSASTATSSTATSLKAGDNNIFNITVKKSDIAASATVAGWNEITPSIDETVKLVNVTATPIDGEVITEGSMLSLALTDASSTKHTTVYTATKGEADALYWKVAENGTPLYWDDIAFNGAETLNVDAVLKIMDDSKEKEENLYAGATTISKSNITGGTGTISFENMAHPLCKLDITINTVESKEKVDLTKINNVVLPKYPWGSYNMTIVPVSGINGNGDISVATPREAATHSYTVYIYPQTITKEKSLVDVSTSENSNVYRLFQTTDTEFKANTHYKITMTLKKSDIAATAKVTIVDWVSGSDIIGDGEITQ